MLLIPCPWCGERAQIEFTYGGDAAPRVPVDPVVDLRSSVDQVYLRANPRGPHSELWHHGAGCRRWFTLRRDTLTHAVLEQDHRDSEQGSANHG